MNQLKIILYHVSFGIKYVLKYILKLNCLLCIKPWKATFVAILRILTFKTILL